MTFLSQLLPLILIGCAGGLLLMNPADEWEAQTLTDFAHVLAFLALILASIGLA